MNEKAAIEINQKLDTMYQSKKEAFLSFAGEGQPFANYCSILVSSGQTVFGVRFSPRE